MCQAFEYFPAFRSDCLGADCDYAGLWWFGNLFCRVSLRVVLFYCILVSIKLCILYSGAGKGSLYVILTLIPRASHYILPTQRIWICQVHWRAYTGDVLPWLGSKSLLQQTFMLLLNDRAASSSTRQPDGQERWYCFLSILASYYSSVIFAFFASIA